MTRDWTSLNARVTASGLDAALLGALRGRWGYSAGGPLQRELQIAQGPVPAVPHLSPTPVAVADQTLSVWADGDALWLGEKLHLEVRERGATITVTPDASEAAWTLAFVEAHRAGGWLPLHASVLAHAGRAVAITGVSGAGKSTAALRLAGTGLQVLAEDHAWVSPERCTVGFDTHLRAYEDSVRRFAPHLLPQAVGHDVHGKLLLPLTRPGGQAVLSALLAFGLPAHPTAAERVRALWEATGVPLTMTGRQRSAAGVTALLPHLPVLGTAREDALELTRTHLNIASD